jgi:Rieske Fe-S protein
MTDKEITKNDGGAGARVTSPLRRRIVFWVPAAVFASMVGSVVTAAFKFLRPRAGEVGVDSATNGGWLPVGKVSDLTGAEPLRREVQVEYRAGWSSTLRDQAVYVLPGQQARVVSATCPHEGCEVEWNGDSREFQCPCHDSAFGPEGARLRGPAQRGLDALPSRVNGDTLEAQITDAQMTEPQTGAAANG